MIVLVTNRPGSVGVNGLLIDVIKYPVFFFWKASLSDFANVTLVSDDYESVIR